MPDKDLTGRVDQIADAVAQLTARVDQLAAIDIDALAVRMTDESVSILAARQRIIADARDEAMAILDAARVAGLDDGQYRPS